MKLAYGRVSAKDQNPERQRVKFRELGVDERYVFVDKQNGKNFDRLQYQAMRLLVRESDLVYIALDRLDRDDDRIITKWKYITRELNANIICLDNEALFDSRKFKTMGDISFSMLAYVGEQERKKNRQWQAEGIVVARTVGVKFRRPRSIINEAFLRADDEWKGGQITATEAMRLAGLKKALFIDGLENMNKMMDCYWNQINKSL